MPARDVQHSASPLCTCIAIDQHVDAQSQRNWYALIAFGVGCHVELAHSYL